MSDSLGLGATFVDYWGVVPLSGFVVLAYMRDWIVAGPRHRRDLAALDERIRHLERERDKWEEIALTAIKASATAIVPAAEVVHSIVTNLPNPAREHPREEGDSP